VNAAVAAPASQTLDRRRVFIFPTRAGFTLAAMLLVILLGAINYDNALGYLLAFLLGGLIMVAMLHTYANLARLTYCGGRAQPVFAGDSVRFECVFENRTPRCRLALHIKHWPRGLKRRERRHLESFTYDFDLDATAQIVVPVTVESQRRGWLTLGRIAVHSDYPLGILRAWAYFESDLRCLIYPRPDGDLPLPYAPTAGRGARAQPVTGVDDFAGLRRYVAGDPVRAIAWRTLAKGQELMVKRFHGEAGAEVWLSWAAIASITDRERALSQLTAWVLACERRNLRYGLDIPGTTLTPDVGPRHRDDCLRALALFGLPA
jgi:uncharacterized protein (DUF58 family)